MAGAVIAKFQQGIQPLKLATMLLTLALAAMSAVQANAQSQSPSVRHAACIAKIDTDPESAYEDALAWMNIGAPRQARHCVAMALIGLGQYAEGAIRLEELANADDGGSLDARRVYLTQAGNAWLLAYAPEAALVALNNALKLAPRNADLRKDIGRAHLLMKSWDLAGKAFDEAIELAPEDAEALTLRGRALLEMGRLQDAWQDAEASLASDPTSVDAVVLRGDIREAMRREGLPDPVTG